MPSMFHCGVEPVYILKVQGLGSYIHLFVKESDPLASIQSLTYLRILKNAVKGTRSPYIVKVSILCSCYSRLNLICLFKIMALNCTCSTQKLLEELSIVETESEVNNLGFFWCESQILSLLSHGSDHDLFERIDINVPSRLLLVNPKSLVDRS